MFIVIVVYSTQDNDISITFANLKKNRILTQKSKSNAYPHTSVCTIMR